MGDIHEPVHDKEKLQAALKYGKKEGCDCVFLGGDFLDAYKISRFVHTPNAPSFQMELQIGVPEDG
jgi:predicted phosphodiesterase